MEASTLWWIVAGVLVAAELTVGTIYLLMLALGAAAGALAAHLGFGSSVQITVAALTGGLTTTAWYVYRRRHRQEPSGTRADRNLNMDIGETVEVMQWDDHGHTHVQYRGASWSARHVGAQPARPGAHRISSLNGNTLELEPI